MEASQDTLNTISAGTKASIVIPHPIFNETRDATLFLHANKPWN